jgi:hypothetical protein
MAAIGGGKVVGLAYDPEAAKHGAQKIWDQLAHVESLIAGEPAHDKVRWKISTVFVVGRTRPACDCRAFSLATTLTCIQLHEAVKAYRELPTFQINWSLIGAFSWTERDGCEVGFAGNTALLFAVHIFKKVG